MREKSTFRFTVGENIIGTPKMQNNYGAIQLISNIGLLTIAI